MPTYMSRAATKSPQAEVLPANLSYTQEKAAPRTCRWHAGRYFDNAARAFQRSEQSAHRVRTNPSLGELLKISKETLTLRYLLRLGHLTKAVKIGNGKIRRSDSQRISPNSNQI